MIKIPRSGGRRDPKVSCRLFQETSSVFESIERGHNRRRQVYKLKYILQNRPVTWHAKATRSARPTASAAKTRRALTSSGLANTRAAPLGERSSIWPHAPPCLLLLRRAARSSPRTGKRSKRSESEVASAGKTWCKISRQEISLGDGNPLTLSRAHERRSREYVGPKASPKDQQALEGAMSMVLPLSGIPGKMHRAA